MKAKIHANDKVQRLAVDRRKDMNDNKEFEEIENSATGSKSAGTACYVAVLRRTVPLEFGAGVETLTKIIKDTDTPSNLYEWAEKQNGNACHLVCLEITKAT